MEKEGIDFVNISKIDIHEEENGSNNRRSSNDSICDISYWNVPVGK